jgi:hypothetical protein
MTISRRELAGTFAAAVPVPAHTTPAPTTEPDDLTVQREQMKKASEALAKVEISQTLEPTFVFKP